MKIYENIFIFMAVYLVTAINTVSSNANIILYVLSCTNLIGALIEHFDPPK